MRISNLSPGSRMDACSTPLTIPDDQGDYEDDHLRSLKLFGCDVRTMCSGHGPSLHKEVNAMISKSVTEFQNQGLARQAVMQLIEGLTTVIADLVLPAAVELWRKLGYQHQSGQRFCYSQLESQQEARV